MQWGVSGDLIPHHLAEVTSEAAARIHAMGFTGVATHFLDTPEESTSNLCQRVRRIFADQGIRVVQAWAWQPCLIHPNDSVRRLAVEQLRAGLRVASQLGAEMVHTGPGSLSLRGPWRAHPGNFEPAAMDRLIDSLQQAVPVAEEVGVLIALEGHVVSTLDSAERMLEACQRVNGAVVKVNLDAVNFLGTIRAFYDNPTVTNHLFDLLQPYIVAGHAKDARVGDKLIVHLDETVPGLGNFDFHVLLRRFAQLPPDTSLIIEHLAPSDVDPAKEYLDRVVVELGIEITPKTGPTRSVIPERIVGAKP
jgi:sugar phosphate isomerase/epimerase